MRAELSLHAKTRIIGMVAHMYAPKRYLGQTRGLKGHEDLIEAVALLQRKRSDFVCVIVGGPWAGAVGYQRRIMRYAHERCGNRVLFLGHRSDVPDLYADMDVVVHPSHSENVGAAAESLLLGVPTIATSVGGFPDLVKPGHTGWLVPAGAPKAICDAITEALDAPVRARAMAELGRQLATDMFDVRKTASAVGRAYSNIVANAKVG
jgi:glycosyltransferase involved in cell wall biosynthesis